MYNLASPLSKICLRTTQRFVPSFRRICAHPSHGSLLRAHVAPRSCYCRRGTAAGLTSRFRPGTLGVKKRLPYFTGFIAARGGKRHNKYIYFYRLKYFCPKYKFFGYLFSFLLSSVPRSNTAATLERGIGEGQPAMVVMSLYESLVRRLYQVSCGLRQKKKHVLMNSYGKVVGYISEQLFESVLK